MSDTVYRHEERTRRPAMFLAAAAGLAMAGLAASYGAPWFFFVPVMLVLLLSGWGIAVNRKSGIVVAPSEVELYSGSWRRRLRTADIKGYSVNPWAEGPDWLYLLLGDGENLRVPTESVGPTAALRVALERVGIEKGLQPQPLVEVQPLQRSAR